MCWGWRFREPEVPGAIAPVPATPEMTQEVGIRNCRLYTLPGDAATQEFAQRLGAAEDDIDALELRMDSAEGDISGLTLDVGDLDSRVDTLEGQIVASDVKVVKVTPNVVSSAIYFSIPVGYKVMWCSLVFVLNGVYKKINLTRINDVVDQQVVNMVDDAGVTGTLLGNPSLGGCVLDDDWSLTYHTGVYGVAVCTPAT